MGRFFSAIRFITILPVGAPETFTPQGMAPYFPLVGLLLGAILAGCDLLFTAIWSLPVASILDGVVLIILTGAFHLDGLSDTADGLLSHRSKERMLEIMKDSRIGAMGMIVTVAVLAVKWAGIMELTRCRPLFLFVIPAYSRGSMLFAMKYLPYGRPEKGLGRDLVNDPMGISWFRFLAVPVAISLLCGVWGVVLNLFFAVLVLLIVFYYRRKLGCVTGDMLGAMTETTEAFLFLLAAAGGGTS